MKRARKIIVIALVGVAVLVGGVNWLGSKLVRVQPPPHALV